MVGETVASGGHGGTGLSFYNGMIYAEINDRTVRYPLAANEIAPRAQGKRSSAACPLRATIRCILSS